MLFRSDGTQAGYHYSVHFILSYLKHSRLFEGIIAGSLPRLNNLGTLQGRCAPQDQIHSDVGTLAGRYPFVVRRLTTRHIANPPSTRSTSPVIYRALSEAKNATALATSSGSPGLRMGIAAFIASLILSLRASVISVAI